MPEAPWRPWPLFPPDKPPQTSMPERHGTLPAETEYSSGTILQASPSGATAHAAAPFTPILPEESPFSSSAAFTADASFRHGLPGRTTTAFPGPWTCAARIFSRRAADMQGRFLLPGSAAVPAAPGPAPSCFHPVFTGTGNILPKNLQRYFSASRYPHSLFHERMIHHPFSCLSIPSRNKNRPI